MKPSICLDAALGVLAVPAHVPLAHRAVGAGHGVGTADDADDEVALLQRAARARVDHPAERLVPEHEARLALGGPAVLALHDLDVGPADADRDGFHEDRPVARVGLGDVFEARAPRLARFDGDGLHRVLPMSRCPCEWLDYFAALAPLTRILIA